MDLLATPDIYQIKTAGGGSERKHFEKAVSLTIINKTPRGEQVSPIGNYFHGKMENKPRSNVTLKGSEIELEKAEQKTEEEDMITSTFPVWSSRVKNLLAYICGVANFPIIILSCTAAGEFGATTLIPHLMARIFIGTPIALIEIMLGRYITGNVSRIAKMCPFSRALFACLILTTVLLVIWNNVFLVYAMKYLTATFSGTLPWADCDSSWADIKCYKKGYNATAFARCLEKYSESYCRNLTWEDSETQYWRQIIGNPMHYPGYNLLYLLIIMALVVFINCKGIRSLEKVLIQFVLGTVLLCFIFLFGSFHTPGEVDGLMHIWYFNTSLLSKPRVWVVTFENCLLSIGLGELVLSSISSHGKIFDDIFLDVLVGILTEVFYFVILAVPITGMIFLTKIRNQAKPSYPLFKDHLDAFISMSAALTDYPRPVILWAGIFYAQMIWQTLANQSVLIMALGDAIHGAFDLESVFTHYFYFVCILGTVMYALSVPALFLPFTSLYPFSTSLLTVSFLFSLTLMVFYGLQKFKADFHFMLGYPAPMFFRFFWVVSIPVLAIFLILKMVYRIPSYPVPYLVYLCVGAPLSVYLFGVILEIFRAHKRKNIQSAFVATPNWGPSEPRLKARRIIFDSISATKEFLYRQELYTKLFVKPIDFTKQNIVQVI